MKETTLKTETRQPVLTETTGECGVCGEVACERDLLFATEDDDCGEFICRDCAE